MAKGSCLCGAVGFEVEGALRAPDACHCTNCRKQSGHYWVSTDVPHAALKISGEENVRWYQSSETVRRGFCVTCGSVLFWDRDGAERIGVGMGAFDAPTGTRMDKHIFVAEKGDYYDITDGLEQIERW